MPSNSFAGVLGPGNSFVVGLPRGFDLFRVIERASHVRLATAFAHISGWKHFRSSITRSTATVHLLTGLDFCQTEPALLQEWLKLSQTHSRIGARLWANRRCTFHPKVLIVHSQEHADIAIIGSGNLSEGGLRTNVECSQFVAGGEVSVLTKWFDLLFDHAEHTTSLSAAAINAYIPLYRRAQQAVHTARQQQEEAEETVTQAQQVTMTRWASAVQQGQRFFRSKEFDISWYKDHKKAVERMREALDYPDFRVTRTGWSDFYNIWNLGRLDPRQRAKAFASPRKVRTALLHLIDESLPIETRIDAVVTLGGTHHVKHLGRNVATKVLTIHDPKRYPTWNAPVEHTLAHFGLDFARGMTVGQKYANVKTLMERLAKDTTARDMLAIDCFMWWWNDRMKTGH